MLEGMIFIKEEEYKRLLDESRFLHLLKAAGVDNWVWYDYVYEIFNRGESK
jgi:hypothetical protein